MIIGLSSKIGAGKDTVAHLIGNGEVRKFADNIKKICAIISGLPLGDMYTQDGKNIYIEQFDMTVGTMQQKIGTEVFRNSFDQNVWVKSLFSKYTPDQLWIITDVRFPNEADYIKSLDGILIRIEGDPAGIRANSTRDLNHPSETSLDDYKFDHVIYNDGTLEELKAKVDALKLV